MVDFTNGVVFTGSISVQVPGLAPASQIAYTTPGTYTWTVPAGVTTISAVGVGGGAGSPYSNSNTAQAGAGGAVRIIWSGGSGVTRQYPSTNTQDF